MPVTDDPTSGRLLPLAIELPGETAPLFAPEFARDTRLADQWVRAKRLHQIAAANYHELGTHLGRCHLVMQPYALATYRKLPPDHPIGRLLRPHFKFMVATNNEAFDKLINPGGPIDHNFMANVDDLLKITEDSVQTFDLRIHGGIEADLANRGFPAQASPVYFAYHQYGIPVYQAIKRFVDDYLARVAYPTRDEVAFRLDTPLWNWNEFCPESTA